MKINSLFFGFFRGSPSFGISCVNSIYSLIALVFIIVFSVALINSSKNNSKEAIFSYVNANYDKLEKITANEINEVWDLDLESLEKYQKTKEMVLNVVQGDTIVECIRTREYDGETIIDFDCSGSGRNMGFYYSKNDTPYSAGYSMELEKTNSIAWHGKDPYNDSS
ncbi:hypothetical protein, partial [Treponema sp. R6D11]